VSFYFSFEIAHRGCLKNRILVQGRGGAAFQTGGILEYFEDLKQGTNNDIGPKDIFEIASNNIMVGLMRSKDNSCSFELFKLAGLKNKKYYDLIQGVWNTTQPNTRFMITTLLACRE